MAKCTRAMYQEHRTFSSYATALATRTMANLANADGRGHAPRRSSIPRLLLAICVSVCSPNAWRTIGLPSQSSLGVSLGYFAACAKRAVFPGKKTRNCLGSSICFFFVFFSLSLSLSLIVRCVETCLRKHPQFERRSVSRNNWVVFCNKPGFLRGAFLGERARFGSGENRSARDSCGDTNVM